MFYIYTIKQIAICSMVYSFPFMLCPNGSWLLRVSEQVRRISTFTLKQRKLLSESQKLEKLEDRSLLNFWRN